jgi:hypothetical protein
VDGQRNDRLGREEQFHQFEHRRQVLRCAYTYTYSDSNSNSKPCPESDADGEPDTDFNTYSAWKSNTVWNTLALSNTDCNYGH